MKNTKSERITIRCTVKEKEIIQKCAESENKSVSELLIERGKIRSRKIQTTSIERQQRNKFIAEAQEMINLMKEGDSNKAQEGVHRLCQILRES